jgi:hypothetical protein
MTEFKKETPKETPALHWTFEGKRCLVSLRGWVETPGKEQVRAVWGVLTYVSDPILLVDNRLSALKGVQKRTPGFLIGLKSPIFIPMGGIDGISVHEHGVAEVELGSNTFNAEA